MFRRTDGHPTGPRRRGASEGARRGRRFPLAGERSWALLETGQKITPADVARVAKTYVKKGDLAILVVGRTEGLDRPLESFGRVATIDITIPEPAGGEAKGAR